MPQPTGRKISLNPMLGGDALRQMVDDTVQSWHLPLPPPPEPGTVVAGEGVYVGQYSPADPAGNSLSKIFNVYAAPEDLPERMKYVEAVKYIAGLKDWHGYNGTNYPTDKEICAALKDGSYSGGWIIPMRDILHGKDADGKETTPDNILAHKNEGSFKGTFKLSVETGRDNDYPGWYWSSTHDPYDIFFVKTVNLLQGFEEWEHKNSFRLSCRPVRLVAV